MPEFVSPLKPRCGHPGVPAPASHLGVGVGFLPRQTEEIWQLWRKLRQEEPHLVGNLEGFLAKMSSRLQEARADKETLEQTLRK